MFHDLEDCIRYQALINNYWWAVTMEYPNAANAYLALLKEHEAKQKQSATKDVAKL